MRIPVYTPERLWVTPHQLIVWAGDDVANGLHDGPAPTDLDGALAVLRETGTVEVCNERYWQHDRDDAEGK